MPITRSDNPEAGSRGSLVARARGDLLAEEGASSQPHPDDDGDHHSGPGDARQDHGTSADYTQYVGYGTCGMGRYQNFGTL